jgi:hypothetical protein
MLKCIECSTWIDEKMLSFSGDAWWCPKCSGENLRPTGDWKERFKDQVNSPQHYADHYPLEVWEMIQLILNSLELEPYEAYCLGSELKYRLRAGFKHEDKIEEDIRKSLWFNKSRRNA